MPHCRHSFKFLQDMSVREILKNKTSELFSIEESHTVLEAVQKMHNAKVGSVIVTKDNGSFSGIFTERDVLRLTAEKYNELGKIHLKDVMTTHVHVASSADTVDDVLNTMISKKFRHVPVIDGDKVIGLISIGDAVKHKLDKTQSEMHMLREFIGGAGHDAFIKP